MSESLLKSEQHTIQQLGIEEEMYAPQQPPLPEPPTTIVIECNKKQAVQDGFAATTNEWTNKFPSMKLKKGDIVSVNSAFLSSRGSGDLLQFDDTNNKTRFIFEYYCTNDNANAKRPSYNIAGYAGEGPEDQIWSSGGKLIGNIKCLPADYRPMKLYRLMETYSLSTIGDGSHLIPQTTPTTVPPSLTNEANWGFNVAKQQINSGVEDNYVPGLLRDPQVNIQESIFRNGNPSLADGTTVTLPDYWGNNYEHARMWYVSTPNSRLSPAGSHELNNKDKASMRIHFAFGTGAVRKPYCDDSLALVKSLRPGMLIQFIDPEYIFGLRCKSYMRTAGAGADLTIPGSNCWGCLGYANDNVGHTSTNVMVDRFCQVGNLEPGANVITQNSWMRSPMTGIFKIQSVYINASQASPGGNNTGGDTLDFCPYIEIVGDQAWSCAWGNPNQTTSVTAYNLAQEVSLGTNTEGNDYFLDRCSPPNTALFRTWVGDSSTTPTPSWIIDKNNPTNAGTIAAGVTHYTAIQNSTFSGTADAGTTTITTTNNGIYVGNIGGVNTFATLEQLLHKGIHSADVQTAISMSAIITNVVNIDTGAYTATAGIKVITIDTALLGNLVAAQIHIMTGVPQPSKFGFKMGILPETPGNNDQFYYGFKPYKSLKMESKEDSGIYHMRTAEMDYTGDTTILNTEFKYKSRLGWGTGEDAEMSMDVVNYNFRQLGRNGKHADIKYGGDYFEDNIYAGGRLPLMYNTINPTEPSNYTTDNYITCSRVHTYSLGSYIQQYAGIQNITQTGEYLSPNGVNANENASNPLNHFPVTQQAPNSNKQFITTGFDKTKSVKFYFSLSVSNTESFAPDLPIVPPTTPFATYGQLADWVDINKNYFANGSVNFVGASANAPNAAYTPEGVNVGGLYYGDNLDNKATQVSYNPTNFMDEGCDDMRFLMSQVQQSFIAKFTNAAGESEYMLIWMCGSGEINWNATPVGSALPAFGTVNPQKRAFMIEKTKANPTADEAKFRGCHPGFIISKRDLGGTGQKVFVGNGAHLLSTPDNTLNKTIKRNVPLPNPGSYFEIVDSVANTEHLFKFDNKNMDLVSFSPQDFTTQKQYVDFIGGAPNPTTPVDTGGQFVLCKTPNQPIVRNNKLDTDYNQFNLIQENLVTGDQASAPLGHAGVVMPAHTGKYSWDVHYDYVDIDLSQAGTDVYYSPGDISTLITKQLHKPTDLYNSKPNTGGRRVAGGTLENTAGKFPANSLYRPIHAPCNKDNKEDPKTGEYAGLYDEGTFMFFKDMKQEFFTRAKYANAWAKSDATTSVLVDDTSDVYPDDGIYGVYPANQWSRLNKAPTTNAMSLSGIGNNTSRGVTTRLYNKTLIDNTNVTDFITNPLNYDSCVASQWIGTSNATLVFNPDVSRFEWQNFHQPVYSSYNSADPSPSTETVARIWATKVDRMENWTRYGGINIKNWCSDATLGFGQWTSRRQENYINPLVGADPVSQAFMNKLGFSESWTQTYSNESTYAEDANDTYKGYKPLGTTDADFDVAQTAIYTADERDKLYFDTLNRNDNTDIASGLNPVSMGADAITVWDQQNVGYLDNPNAPYTNIFGGTYGLQNLEVPEKTDGTAEWQNNHRTFGQSIAYGFPNTQNTPKSVKKVAMGTAASVSDANGTVKGTAAKWIYTDLNYDDIKFPYWQVKVDSTGLRADLIPSKTDIGYFLIMSDLIDKHEFIGSANGGQPLNCIGILSKNYENNDFYFSFQSPVEFHIKNDKTISTITTRILTPDLKTPAGLDYASSIIYSIVRQNNVPEPDVPPISVQQAYEYATMDYMETLSGGGGAFAGPQGVGNLFGIGSGGGAGLNQMRQNLVQSVLNPDNNTSAMVSAYSTELGATLGRMSAKGRQALGRQGLYAPPTPIAFEASSGTAAVGDAAPVMAQVEEQQEEEAHQHVAPQLETAMKADKPFFGGDDEWEQHSLASYNQLVTPPPSYHSGVFAAGMEAQGSRARGLSYDRMRRGSSAERDVVAVRSASGESLHEEAFHNQPEYLSPAEFFHHMSHHLPQHLQTKLRSAVDGGHTDWNNPRQIPPDLLKVMASGRTMTGNKGLEPKYVDEARKEIELRKTEGRRTEQSKERVETTQPTPVGAQGSSQAHAHGDKKLYDWLKDGGKSGDHPHETYYEKGENKFDIHTWRKGLLNQMDRHKHAFSAPSDVRDRWHKGTTTHEDKKHLFRKEDGYLFEEEVKRRGTSRAKNSDSASYKKQGAGSTAPQHYDAKHPENTPRGVGAIRLGSQVATIKSQRRGADTRQAGGAAPSEVKTI